MTNKTPRLKKLKFLRILKKLNSEDRICLLNFLNESALDEVCRCVHNVLFENWNLKPSSVKRLRRILKGKEKQMSEIVKKSNCLKKRKKIIIQQGGSALGSILRIAVPLITDLIFRSKK